MIVQKNKFGEAGKGLIEEFNVGLSTIYSMYENTKSFKEIELLTEYPKEIKKLKKAKMEKGILKQA